MNLAVQHFRLSELAEAGFNLDPLPGDIDESGTPAPMAIAQCFAFRFDALLDQAASEGLPWHIWLLRRAIAGLLEEHFKKKAAICYTLHPGIVRLFLCTKQKRFPARFHALVSLLPAYMESAQDSFPPSRARWLAYWEAPATAVALWPRGLQGETQEPRVVDTGNALAYFSYPESNHDSGIPVGEAGPEFIRVPRQEHDSFEANGRAYRWLNRWSAAEIDLRYDF